MTTSRERALRSAAEVYAVARVDLDLARSKAEAAWTRLQASPDTLEYQIDWSVARRREAAVAARARQAERDYVMAGGYVVTDSGE
jgi:hypothetical protein